MNLLEVRGLEVEFPTEDGPIRPSRGISFDVAEGEVVGLVGESGSGKSVTAKALLRLIEPESAIRGGEVLFKGLDVLGMRESELNRLRAREIAMIFQDPANSLNPVLRVGHQVARVFENDHRRSRAGRRWGSNRGLAKLARERASELLRTVMIPDPLTRYMQYPHQFSGGMLQRAMLAMSLICRPSLLIADEPTTALDVTVESQIIQLLKDLQQDFGMAMLFISHDLGVIAKLCDWVLVFYAGRIVEKAATTDLFESPQHPYTRALLHSIPLGTKASGSLVVIKGEPPNLARLPEGCPFQARCAYAVDACRAEQKLREITPGHRVACHKAPFQ